MIDCNDDEPSAYVPQPHLNPTDETGVRNIQSAANLTAPSSAAIDDPRFRLAWKIMNEVDEISSHAFVRKQYQVWYKSDRTVVTDVDTTIERMFSAGLTKDFPHDEMLGEELTHATTTSCDHLWYIDPIDATSNFIRGIPIYAHMIALQMNGATTFGIVSAPMLKKRWWAYAGAGSHQGDQTLRVSDTDSLTAAMISYGGLNGFGAKREGLINLVTACHRSRGFGNFWSHMLVAEGGTDLAISGAACRPWDIAPLQIIITEAGGMFTSFDGSTHPTTGPILSSNGKLQSPALAILEGS